MNGTSSTTAMLITYLSRLRGSVLMLGVLLVAGTAAQLTAPLILREFVDGAVGGESLRRLYILGAVFLAAAAVTQVLVVGTAYLSEQVGWSATNRLRADLLRHTLDLDLSFHHAHPPGDLIERIDGDVTALSTFFSQFVLRIVGGGLLLFSVVVLVLIEEWRVGAVFAAFVVTTLAVLTGARRFAVPRVDTAREASAGLYGFLEERLGAVDDIRANGAGTYVMRRYRDVNRDLVYTSRTAEVASATVWTLATGMFTASYIVVLGLSGYLYRQGDISIGTVYLFFQYTQILRRPLEMLADQLKEFQRAAASIGRVHALAVLRTTLPEGQASAAASGPASVAFRNVDFAYHEGEPVLHGVSFRLEPGQVLGVLGHTGGGKSTLTRLLLRFYDATSGSVALDGTDVRELRMDELRRRIGVVTQEVQLVSGSVRDNLTLFAPGIADDRLRDALEDLGLRSWVEALPYGLETRLGGADFGLSAGEAQLLALGRVFLRDPGLVILDEASSRLDPATEALAEEALSRLLRGRTGVVIAHRLHALHRADVILVLEHGRVVEFGPRLVLAADPHSRYAMLIAASAGAVHA